MSVNVRAQFRCLLLTALATGVAACHSQDPKEIAREQNVVLIVLDTVRADHVSCYGYSRLTTPLIDTFAQHATRYTRAFSDAPWTLPSHASMFTGKAPHEHGAHTFKVPPQGLPKDQDDVTPLPENVPVITEAFHRLGYRTAAFVANDVYLSRRWGLWRGFDTYAVNNETGDLHDRRIDHWLATEAHAPFFLFVNYIDAHRPYNVKPHKGLLDHPYVGNGYIIDQLKQAVMGHPGPAPQVLVDRTIDAYDTGVANIDDAVGDLLLALARHGLRKNTIIIITADHGEYFGEHGLAEHNLDVYQQALHVPLLITAPGHRAARTDPTIVTSRDMPFLIAQRIQSKRVRDALEHFSRGPGTHPVLSENYYSRLWDLSSPWGSRFQRVRRALFKWPYKLIWSSDGHHELYDLSRDPGEQNNLISRESAIASRMIREVEREAGVQHHVAPQVQSLSKQEMQRMRALGYAR